MSPAGRAGGGAGRSRPPADTATAQVGRLLALVPWLHAADGVRLSEAAAALGTSQEQVLADLRVLFMCGLPGGFPDDLIDVDLDAISTEVDGDLAPRDGLVQVTNADYLRRPLRLSPTEASALVVALWAVRAGADERTLEVIDRAAAKLQAVAADASVPAALAGGAADEAAEAALAARLADAVRDGRQVRLRYYVPARDEESERVVDPRGVVGHAGHRYLDAWCHRAEGERLFRLDRVAEAEVLGSAVTTERVPPRDLAARGLFATGGASTATVRLAPAARWVPEYYPMRARRETADGGLEVDLVVADPRWLERLVLRLAPHALVLGPPELAQRCTASAHAALGHYG